MSKSTILLSCLTLIVALVVKTLIDFGIFRSIKPQGLDQCRLIKPSNADHLAFEDFSVDYEKGFGYLPGDDRRWWFNYRLSDETAQKQGTIFRFDIASESFTKLNLIDYPYEHFHPLGIGLLKGKTDRLFMTSFRPNNGQVRGSVDIFEIDSSDENQLKFIDSVVHPLFTVPDDVLAIDEKTFYVTNVWNYPKDKTAVLHQIEVLTKRPWTNVVLCVKTNEWQCSVVADSIKMANGIAASTDFQTIYVAGSSEKRIHIYDRHIENNSLTYIRSLSVPFLLDNLAVDENDQLVAAGHPNALAFFQHIENPDKARAPSEVVVFPNPKTSLTYKTLLLTNGELLSASTTGAIYKQKLLVSAICDPGILLCKNLF